ncbi:hypothetical protein MPER_13560, partial [Moniliophthora perniciosa FA553]
FPGDENDDWIVEIFEDNPEYLWTYMAATLRHALTGCYLAAGKDIKLPEWGFNETAVYCGRNVPSKKGVGLDAIWVVFNSTHPHGSVGGFLSNIFKSFNLFE